MAQSLRVSTASPPSSGCKTPLAAYTPDENDPEERIDFLWYAGAVEVESSEIVGERGFPGVTISVDPWPTDHRGVLSQFSVTPAPLPPLVTNAVPDGKITLNASTVEFGWPVAPGNYVLRLLKDDGDEVLAESSVFTVR